MRSAWSFQTPRSAVDAAKPRARTNAVPAAAAHDESAAQVADDVAAVGRLSAVPTMLRVLCDATGMGFAAVARVSDVSWTACAVHDTIDFGLRPGMQLDRETTLCKEVRAARAPVVIEHASEDPTYRDHATPRLYRIESYASFPIVLADATYFGNLCCIDPAPARIADGRTRAMFQQFAELIGHQLDEERRREQAQSALLGERAAGELREQFIAILGHDLRNPLSAVSACANLLKLRTSDPATGRLLDILLKNVGRMGMLIDDTLDFARVRLGSGLSLHLEWTSGVAAAIDDVVEAVRVAHPARRVSSSVAIDRAVRCDLPRVQQIASNLLGNAVAHGAADGDIEVRAWSDERDVQLSVRNQGEPIPPAAIEMMFQPFWRQARGGDHDGLGLGLHICAEVAKAHGGSLSVTSSAAEGTTFVARLPIAGPAP